MLYSSNLLLLTPQFSNFSFTEAPNMLSFINLSDVMVIQNFSEKTNFFMPTSMLSLYDFLDQPFSVFYNSQPLSLSTSLQAFSQLCDKNTSNLSIEEDPIVYINIEPEYLDEEGLDIRYSFKYTLPDAKLTYPEPNVASPSYLHQDLAYLCILQYWYWLWVIFIYLIFFFFLSFLVVSRWCATHKKPVRETQGVSRSKCGDLITACVPVSWAASIIISESTDTADLNDGFGTGEVVLGVRAYQWGWEYYYPRSIDLGYNVTPTYSSFVGNSLRYNHASETTNTSNNFWRQYQKKSQDAPVTPAHIIFNSLGTVNSSSQNFLNDAGLDNLHASSAFPKIRNNTKIYNTHLVNLTTPDTKKNYLLTEHYKSPTDPLLALDYSLNRPSTFLTSISYLNPKFTNSNSDTFANFLNESSTSATEPTNSTINANHFNTFNKDLPINSSRLQVSTLSDAEDKILPTEQFVQQQKFANPTLKNESSTSPNKIASLTNLTTSLVSQPKSTLASAFDLNLNSDTHLTSRIFVKKPLTPVLSSNPLRGVDSTTPFNGTELHRFFELGSDEINVKTTRNPNTTVEANVGSIEKIPASLIELYWSTCWSNLSPELRKDALKTLSTNLNDFYVQPFTAYSDYDFRNEQSLMLMEDLFWESPYPTFTFYDYLNLSDLANKGDSPTPVITEMSSLFTPTNHYLSDNYVTSNTSSVDSALAPLRSDENFTNSTLLTTKTINLLSAVTETQDLEDSYVSSKTTTFSSIDQKPHTLLLTSPSKFFVSSSKTFNNFTTSHTDFNVSAPFNTPNLIQSNLNSDTTKTYLLQYMNRLNYASHIPTLNPAISFLLSHYINFYNLSSYHITDLITGNSVTSSSVNLLPNLNSLIPSNHLRNNYTLANTNSLNIRASVKDAIVNYSAFQKVFRSRFDEGRSHSNWSNFQNLYEKQPFLNDKVVPYTNLLGKNRISFYTTNLFNQFMSTSSNSLNSLYTQNNTQMFEFPFLDALQSDIIRYTWMDGYSKWRYVEVQPSSVAKYSLVGVPYLRKPYDFNTNTGDHLSDMQGYFTRITRARKNYLPNWLYSPLLFNRSSQFTHGTSLISSLKNTSGSSSEFMTLLYLVRSLRDSVLYDFNYTNFSHSSISGNSLYNKSTWRSHSNISTYYHDLPHLVEILSKRENLIRDYRLNTEGTAYLPIEFTANPQNPLLNSVKSSFAVTNPLTFNLEYDRGYIYSSAWYFKFLELKSLIKFLDKTSQVVPFNTSLVNEYVLLYFLNLNKEGVSKFNELYRNQFRPLRKGVNSMLRLHATGAVAMPVEIRLQILASSRDVIHSWAIPAAGIKIDCIPGYTSHRIMKFMLTGIYWGQCQEICGRYHHWMPIVVYFIKRDLFFLWCTHFVYRSQKFDDIEVSDSSFKNFVKFVSYDRSTWLTELRSLN